MFEKLDLGVSSCYEIGRRQYAGAKSLYVRIVPGPAGKGGLLDVNQFC
jgi:hypothetical protein